MNIGTSYNLIQPSKPIIPPATKLDEGSINDFKALQKHFLNIQRDSKMDIVGERSEEFIELQEVMITIFTSAKLLGYKTHINERETSIRVYLPDGVGLTTIHLREVFNKVSLKIYQRSFESVHSINMLTETYSRESVEEKLKALQKILENL